VRVPPTNWVDYCLWVLVAFALVYWHFETEARKVSAPNDVWRVRTSIGPTIISDTIVRSRVVTYVSCSWKTNFVNGAIVIETIIETNLLDIATGKVLTK